MLAPVTESTDVDLGRARDGLNDGTLRWNDFLLKHELRLPCGLLHYIAYWVTPRGESKRFSTRFFVAEMPHGQEAFHDGAELTHSCWMTGRDILHAGRTGEMKLQWPTRSTLKEIAAFESVEQIVAWAKSRADSGIARELPAFVTVDGTDMVVMPGSPHYPEDFDL